MLFGGESLFRGLKKTRVHGIMMKNGKIGAERYEICRTDGAYDDGGERDRRRRHVELYELRRVHFRHRGRHRPAKEQRRAVLGLYGRESDRGRGRAGGGRTRQVLRGGGHRGGDLPGHPAGHPGGEGAERRGNPPSVRWKTSSGKWTATNGGISGKSISVHSSGAHRRRARMESITRPPRRRGRPARLQYGVRHGRTRDDVHVRRTHAGVHHARIGVHRRRVRQRHSGHFPR